MFNQARARITGTDCNASSQLDRTRTSGVYNASENSESGTDMGNSFKGAYAHFLSPVLNLREVDPSEDGVVGKHILRPVAS